jgi:hypothetical protein
MKKSIVFIILVVASSAHVTMPTVDLKKDIIVINVSVFEDITIATGIGHMNKATIKVNNNMRNDPNSAGAITLKVGDTMEITASDIKKHRVVAKTTYKRASIHDTVFTVTVSGPEDARHILIESITPKLGDTWRLFKKYSYLSDYLPAPSTAAPLKESNKI